MSAAASASDDAAPQLTVQIKGPSELRLHITIAADATVRQLKERIQQEKSDVTAESQRLIYSGKVLKDDETLAFYKLVNGHTIHMVRSASRSAPVTGNPSTGAAGQPSSTPQNAAAGVPANFGQIGAGQQFANNPLSALNRADYAGPQLTAAQNQMLAGSGMNLSDPNAMMNMMNDPEVRAQMRQVLSRPEVIDQIIASHPELANLPGAREMLRSPGFIDMLTDPAAMQRAAQMAQMMGGPGGRGAGMFGGAGGAGMFGAAGGQPQWPPAGAFGGAAQQGGEGQGAAQTGQAPPNPFAGLGGAGGAGAGGMMDPAFLRQLFGAPEGGAGAGAGGAGGAAPPNPFAAFGAGFGAGAGAGGSAPARPADSRPPEERYADQLAQMQDMGLTDGPKNLRALLLSGGSVEGAVTIIYDGGAQ